MAFVLFPLTAAAFDSGWFSLSLAGGRRVRRTSPRTGAVPSTVKVSVKAVDGANVDYVFNGWGAPQSSGYTIKEYGGLVYAQREHRAVVGADVYEQRQAGRRARLLPARTASAPPRRW